MKRLLGVLMLSVVFLGMFLTIATMHKGIAVAAIIFGVAIAITAVLVVAVYLISV